MKKILGDIMSLFTSSSKFFRSDTDDENNEYDYASIISKLYNKLSNVFSS
ncbi:MAG TPA: hypothetical protein PKN75_08195 [Bacteroidia bacterium]|nr:hypothetical protein [Bacteroidia bacterium]HNU33558.1 hypothetical protein [Bacteroidia bacterium]